MEDIVYVVNDHFEMSEEIKNMSEEELDRQIAILEEAAKMEKEKIEAREKKKLCLWFNLKGL